MLNMLWNIKKSISSVPKEYENIFKTIDCYIENNSYKREYLLKDDVECNESIKIRDGYNQCYDVKGISDGTK